MRLSDVENQANECDLTDLPSMAIEVLRARRAALQATEAQVSFVRRVVQVRLDLLLAFVESDQDIVERRADVLLAALPDIVRPTAVTAHRRPPASRRMVVPDAELVAEAELAGGFDVVAVGGRSDDEIAEALASLTAFERRASALRRALHRQIDDIQSEIARRYSCGELVIGA